MANVTITGAFADPNGTVPTSGVVTFTLDGQMITAGGTIIAVKPESATLTTGGFSILLGSTTDSTPANRTYGVTLTALVEGVNVTQAIGSFQLAPSPSSQNLVDLILQSAVDTSATLSLLTLSVLRLNNIRYADQFPGADAGAKISAAIADLPGTGGTVDARGLQGTQAGTATVTIPANVTVLLGAITYTINFAGIGFKTSGRGARLIGQDYDTSIILQNFTSAPYAAVRPEADGFTLKDFQISGEVPSGSEGAALSAVMLSKSSLLLDGLIDGVYITGTNGGVYADTLVPSGMKNIRVRNCKIRTLHWGVILGPYAGGIVNDSLFVEHNDIEVSAIGSYTGYEFARTIQVLNCNNGAIRFNRAIGGFGLETFGNLGNPSTGRPHQRNMQVVGNTTDAFISFVQVDAGECHSNIVDSALRDGSWPAIDSAAVLTAFGPLPGIEIADLLNCTLGPDTIRGPVGAGYDFGGCAGCILRVGSISNTGNTASPSATRSSGIILEYALTDCKIIGGAIDTSATYAISQIVAGGYLISRLSIEGITMRNIQKHGVEISNTVGITITNCEVYHPNLASGSFDAYHFEKQQLGDQMSRVIVTDNLSDGGRYGIYHDETDAASNRLSMISGNKCVNATTRAFKIQCRRRNNTSGDALTTVSLSSGHLDGSVGIDFVTLDPGGSANFTFIDNLTEGDEMLIYFARVDTDVKHDVTKLVLAGSADYTPSAGTFMKFICGNAVSATAEVNLETSRSR